MDLLHGWVSRIFKLISLGPLYLLFCFCVIHGGLLAPAYPARANEDRNSVKMGSVAPSLLRASIAGDRYVLPESWMATKTILLQRENEGC